MRRRISILGSTGSIGRSTLSVVENFPEKFEVIGLAAKSNYQYLEEQIRKFHPQVVALRNEEAARELALRINDLSVTIWSGEEGIIRIATLNEGDLVVSAMAGSEGLLPTLAAIRRGKTLALANKETLVMAGEIVMAESRRKGVNILPVDSEHSAIFQCLSGHRKEEITRILLTASGGPFYHWEKDKLSSVTCEEALAHPTWKMGKKVTVDSATLMNKGLEVIEAHWLFEVDVSQIEVLIHPQSVLHSLVEFKDGSMLAQLAITDMRIPIQYALTYPQRWTNTLPRLDLIGLKALTFSSPDLEKFPCLGYAYEAARKGGSMPAVLNAANEEAVFAFLGRRISFDRIPQIIRRVMDKHQVISSPTLEQILETDQWARGEARHFLLD